MADNRIAFGLCKKFKIDLPDDATPKDAWQALKKLGISNLKTPKDTVVDPEEVIKKYDSVNTRMFSELPTIRLSKKEYAMVMHEIATNMPRKDYSKQAVVRHIRNHSYFVEILGFGEYRVIGKWLIKPRRG